MIWADLDYTIKVYINGSKKGTTIPLEWNTTGYDGWINITVVANDTLNNIGKDEVWILVDNTPQSGVINTWYTIYDEDVWITTSTVWVNITQMNTTINIEGDRNVSLYLSFCSLARNNASADNGKTYVGFSLDGKEKSPPYTEMQGTYWTPISLQQVISDVTPGIHLIQVQGKVDKAAGLIGWSDMGMTLLVQSLIP